MSRGPDAVPASAEQDAAAPGSGVSGRQELDAEAPSLASGSVLRDEPEPGVTFDDYLLAIEQLEERIRGLEAELEAIAQEEPYREPVGWLRCFRGIDTVSALTIVGELHDFGRFESPRPLMAYLGLVPSEHSSGGSRRRAGSPSPAIATCAECWSRPPGTTATGPASASFAGSERGQPAHHRSGRPCAGAPQPALLPWCSNHKPSQKAVVAIARELVGFLWAALVLYPQLQSQEVTH